MPLDDSALARYTGLMRNHLVARSPMGAVLLVALACGGASSPDESADPRDPDIESVEGLIAQATDHERAGALDEAIVKLRQASSEAEAAELVELQVRALRRLGGLALIAARYADAGEAFEQALALERARSPEGSALLALCLSGQGELEHVLGHFEAARARHEEALATVLRDELRTDRAEAEVRFAMGHFLSDMRELDEALVHLRRAVELRALLFGESSKEHLDASETLAAALDYSERYSEAEVLFREILTQREANPVLDDLPRALVNLAVNLELQDRGDEAVPLLERATEVVSEGAASAELRGQIALALGNAYSSLERLDDARAQYEECLRIRQEHHGAEHPEVAVPLYNLAQIALAQSRPADAVSMLERALSIRTGVLPAQHPWLLETQAKLEAAREAVAAAPEDAESETETPSDDAEAS